LTHPGSYYIYPTEVLERPLFLIPASQVFDLIGKINDSLQIGLFFPLEATESGFLLEFQDDQTPRPRYLGHTMSRSDFETLQTMLSSTTFQSRNPRPAGYTKASKEALGEFKAKLDRAVDAGRNKTTAVKAKKKAERFERQLGYIRQIRRAQRYVGLRQRGQSAYQPEESGGRVYTGKDRNRPTDLLGPSTPTSFDRNYTVDVPTPFEPDGHVIFICIDVEAYEKNNNFVTEIGVSTLDTTNLFESPPGDGCSQWNSMIRSRHFRIKDHSHFRNGAYVEDCADQFDFGHSEWIELEDASRVVASCFKPPYSNLSIPTNQINHDERRRLVLVGHDIKTDIAYLRRIGFDVTNNQHIVEALDTALMFRALKHEAHNRSLGVVLFELGLVGWHLHNAGNDAIYTLQALLNIAVQDLTGDHKGRSEAEKRQRAQDLMHEATQRAQEEDEGWGDIDDEDDGGAPVAVEVPGPSSEKREANVVESSYERPPSQQTRLVYSIPHEVKKENRYEHGSGW
jgi:hypothetical protein